MRRTVFIVALSLVSFTPAVAAPVPNVRALRIDQPPRIDGALDDACWGKAEPLTNFTQVLPVQGVPPSERTELRFVYTRDVLFIGIRCFDRHPEKILVKTMQRDNPFDSDDYVKIAFDTFGKGRDGYVFMINAAGARTDSIFGKFSEEDRNFDAIWDARARVDAQGWTAEIAIPFKSISFDVRNDFWRMNVERVIRHKQETVRWSAISRAKQVTALEDFGELRDLRGLRQGFGLDFRPYVRTTYRDDAFPHTRGLVFDSGFDLTYRITPSLTAVGTVRTDFAETEPDERIINLSRFPTFFPEKRDFFLQDAQLFTFGGLTGDDRPYYSRRIGLGALVRDVEFLPVTIFGGARVTGRIGETSVALLDVEQAAHDGIEEKNLAVARLTQQLSDEWNVGLIATNGDPLANGNATLAGADFNFQRNLPDDRQLIAHGYLMGVTSDTSGDDVAFGADIDYPNEPLNVHLRFQQWGEHFTFPLGFLEQNNIRYYRGSFTYIWRPNTAWVRSISVQARPFFGTDLDNLLIFEDHDIPFVKLTTPALDEIGAGYTFERDFPHEPFELIPGLILPPHNYSWSLFQGYIHTSEARPISLKFDLRLGDYYGGTRSDYRAEINWHPSRFFLIGASYDLRELRLAEGDIDVRIMTGRVNIAFTPDLVWNTLVQYDNVSRQLGVDSRLRWTWRPGTDLFLIFNNLWDYEDGELRQPNTEVTFKAVAAFRF
jgi:hypothetical protein